MIKKLILIILILTLLGCYRVIKTQEEDDFIDIYKFVVTMANKNELEIIETLKLITDFRDVYLYNVNKTFPVVNLVKLQPFFDTIFYHYIIHLYKKYYYSSRLKIKIPSYNESLASQITLSYLYLNYYKEISDGLEKEYNLLLREYIKEYIIYDSTNYIFLYTVLPTKLELFISTTITIYSLFN